MKSKAGIFPTLACADYLDLRNQIDIMDRAKVASYHIDIMDGNFVPNYCLNFDYLKAVSSYTDTPCDVHLMTGEVERDIRTSLECGAAAVAFHSERTDLDIPALLRMIKSGGAKAGLVLSPHQAVHELEPWLGMTDYVIMMGVKPGFAGQRFIDDTLDRVRTLSSLRLDKGFTFRILVDGGISFENAAKCVSAGADDLVAGALCIFSKDGGLEENIDRFSACLE